jgi:alpha-tubulin suppressor-like RCC1 family protein
MNSVKAPISVAPTLRAWALIIALAVSVTHAAAAATVPVVSAGAAHSLSLGSDGELLGWGDWSYAQAGIRLSDAASVPTRFLSTTVGLAAGGYHSLAVRDDGSVWAWGLNSSRQLGFYDFNAYVARPTLVPGVTNVSSVAAGKDHSLALRSDGQVLTWGNHASGQLGLGNLAGGLTRVTNPTLIAGLTSIASITAGSAHSLALDQGGRTWAWGSDFYAQAGALPTEAGAGKQVRAPRIVNGLPLFSAVAGGGFHSLGLTADGKVLAWGNNTYGQLARPVAESLAPSVIAGLPKVTKIAAGHHHSVALAEDGSVWAWGRIGGNSTAATYAVEPLRIGLAGSAIAIAAGFQHSLAVGVDGLVQAWGGNAAGQLGDGTYADRSEPVLVVKETLDGMLDLLPTVPNVIPIDLVPPFFAKALRRGDATSLSLDVEIRGLPDALFSLSQTKFMRAARTGAYHVYVVALANTGVTATWFQLNSNRTWSALTLPLAEYLSNQSLSAMIDSVVFNILDSLDVSALYGTRIFVGYGTDADEMVRAKRYREMMIIPEPAP